MSAVWMRLRSEIRTRWRSWLGLALLIGLAGAAAVAAAAGARRTETAYPRFVQAQNGYDLITGGSSGNIDPGRGLTQIEAMPAVGQWARIDVAASSAILPSGRMAPAPELMAVTDLSGRAGFRLNRFKVISGRIANLRAQLTRTRADLRGRGRTVTCTERRGWTCCRQMACKRSAVRARLAPQEMAGQGMILGPYGIFQDRPTVI